ncbi:MAG: DUF6364 family protein [Methanobacteriaceae archaeon]
MENSKVKTTLNLEKSVIKTIKQIALNKEKTQTEIINEYLKKGIKSERMKNKEKKSLNEISGMFKAKESFDSVEELRKIEYGE